MKIKIHRTIVLPVVLCGCKAWSLKLRKEHRLMLLERKELKEIFGLKWDEVTGEWRYRMNREDLCALYTLPNIRVINSRKNQMAGTCEHMGYRRRTYRVLLDRLERRPLGRPTPRWEDNITMVLQEVGLGRKVLY